MFSSVSLIITTRCNLSCKYCYYNKNSNVYNKNEGFLSTMSISNFFSQYAGKKLDVISITGGEPFLHPEINKIIDLIMPYTKSIVILTNGTLLTENEILWLKDRNIELHISIDSLSYDYNGKVRGQHPKLMSTLNVLQKYNYTNVVLTPTLSSKNMDDAMEVIKYANANGFKASIGLVDLEKSNELSLENLTDDNKHTLFQILDYILNSKNSEFYKILAAYLINDKDKLKLNNCFFAANNIVCDSDGIIYPCFHRKQPLGSIEEKFELIQENHSKFCEENKGKFNCCTTACFSLF